MLGESWAREWSRDLSYCSNPTRLGCSSLKMLAPEGKSCTPERGIGRDRYTAGAKSHYALQLCRRSQILQGECQVALFSKCLLNPRPALTRPLPLPSGDETFCFLELAFNVSRLHILHVKWRWKVVPI